MPKDIVTPGEGLPEKLSLCLLSVTGLLVILL
jgi:hypothetical protein